MLRPRTNNAEYVDNDRVTAEKHSENRETINGKPEHPQREPFDSEFIRDNSHITYPIAMPLNMYKCEALLSGLLKHMPDILVNQSAYAFFGRPNRPDESFEPKY